MIKLISSEILGSLKDKNYDGTVDYVDFEWYEVNKKIHLKKSRGGQEIGIRFGDFVLHHGVKQDDILAIAGRTIYAVNILPCEAIKISVEDVQMLPKICYEIGNRHAPLFYGDGHKVLLTPYNLPMFEMLNNLGVCVSVEKIAFDFDKSISETAAAHVH